MRRRLASVLALPLVLALAAAPLAACGDDGGGGGGTDDAALPDDAGAVVSHDLKGAPPVDLEGAPPVDLASGGSTPDLAVPPGPPPTTTAVTVHLEPDEGMTPVLSAINGAKKSIHLEIYYLGSSSVISALESAKNKGLDVKVILEQHPMGPSNSSTYTTLQSAGVPVQWSNPAYTLTHEKGMIIDGATLWAMTMNLDSTAASSNREYLLVDTDPADVAEAEGVFQADWGHTSPTVTRLVVSPVTSSQKIYATIKAATSTLDIEWEELSDNQTAYSIQTALKAGVKVRVILPSKLSPATMTMAGTLKSIGVQVRTITSPYMHAKLVFVDGSWGFIGSENATSPSLTQNRELGVLWKNATVAQKISAAFSSDWSSATPF